MLVISKGKEAGEELAEKGIRDETGYWRKYCKQAQIED